MYTFCIWYGRGKKKEKFTSFFDEACAGFAEASEASYHLNDDEVEYFLHSHWYFKAEGSSYSSAFSSKFAHCKSVRMVELSSRGCTELFEYPFASKFSFCWLWMENTPLLEWMTASVFVCVNVCVCECWFVLTQHYNDKILHIVVFYQQILYFFLFLLLSLVLSVSAGLLYKCWEEWELFFPFYVRYNKNSINRKKAINRDWEGFWFVFNVYPFSFHNAA